MKNLKISETLLQKTKLLLFVTLLCCTTSVTARDNEYNKWCDSLKVRLDSLLEDDLFRTSQVGICIYDLTEDDLIYSHNELQTMRPASTQKIITAITALKVLGADHRIYTDVNYTGTIDSRTLNGNIYFKGNFDPLLNDSSLIELTRSIKEAGIDTICGNIFLDKSMKEELEFGEGWCWDDENPTLSPLTINAKDEFLTAITTAFENTGIYINADAGPGICPSEAKLICRTYHTIGDILPEMLKESDNFFAEAIFYNIAASTEKPWATSRDAVMVIDRLIHHIGHNKSEYRIADGSGLSLYNYTTAKIETDFLRYAYSKKRIYTHLYEALPIAGIDGTLKNRMKMYRNTAGNVRAKTGSVSCVSSLAGYCKASNGHQIAFCIINQGVLKSRKARNFQDKVCALLCEGINTELN